MESECWRCDLPECRCVSVQNNHRLFTRRVFRGRDFKRVDVIGIFVVFVFVMRQINLLEVFMRPIGRVVGQRRSGGEWCVGIGGANVSWQGIGGMFRCLRRIRSRDENISKR